MNTLAILVPPQVSVAESPLSIVVGEMESEQAEPPPPPPPPTSTVAVQVAVPPGPVAVPVKVVSLVIAPLMREPLATGVTEPMP
jgi:hypothetical protein